MFESHDEETNHHFKTNIYVFSYLDLIGAIF